MKLGVKVVPNSKEFSLKEKEGYWRVNLTEKAEGNKANLELIKRIKKITGKEVRLIRGAKSRRKILEVNEDEQKVIDKLREKAETKGD